VKGNPPRSHRVGPPRAGGPRPHAAPLVAVLERSGRFLTAEPLFGRPDAEPPGPRTRGPRRIVVRAGGSRGAAARPGDLVLLELGRGGNEARVSRVLGRPDVARDVVGALLFDRGLHGSFSAEVEDEARRAARRVARSATARRDLRDLATFTVDPAGARDFDDAISAERRGTGGARVWVHIADVAAHIRPGSALDAEARRRATSVYVPGTVEPMLPHTLSSDACSLMPGRDRPAVTVEMELEGAEVVSASFYRSLIRSNARLDYDQVDRIFDGAEQAAEEWRPGLEAARAVAHDLQRRREQRQAIVIDSAEPEFEFDDGGDVVAIHSRTQTEAHRLIEHLMIAANEAVASLLSRRGVPCLYRVHERPDPERVVRLVDQLASLEVPTPPVPEPLSSTQAARLLGDLSALVDRYAQSTGRGRVAFGAMILRAVKQAYYSPVNLGHSGLGSTAYCHFTSPIRRYPDVVCHRALLAAVGGGEDAPAADGLAELGGWTSEREREAMKIERDADDIARCFALERRLRELGWEEAHEGEVAGLISAGAFVAFDTGPRDGARLSPAPPPFQGLLAVRLLRAPDGAAGPPPARGQARREREAPREWWELNEEGTILAGERTRAAIRLGDPIEVRVGRVDAVRGRVDLLPAG
jgi:ribonuclease R